MGESLPKIFVKNSRNLFRVVWLLALMLMLGLIACTPQRVPPPTEGVSAPTASGAADPAATGQTAAPPPTASPSATRTPTPTTPPTATPSPTPFPNTPTPLACWEAGGQIEQHQLYTELSPWPWEYRVYTPPCYAQQPERRYPLLILIHGSTFTDDQWDRMGADETADTLIASGETPPFIILMPRDRVWRDPPDDPFGQALAEHILPWVDENYRTMPERDNRAIGGLSRGAAWAVHLGLSRWELFGAIGGHSLPVFWSDTPHVRTWLDDIPSTQMPRFYLDIGEKDYLIESAIWFESVLTEKGIPHEWHLFSGRHEEAYWEAHLEQYLRWYAEGW